MPSRSTARTTADKASSDLADATISDFVIPDLIRDPERAHGNPVGNRHAADAASEIPALRCAPAGMTETGWSACGRAGTIEIARDGD